MINRIIVHCITYKNGEEKDTNSDHESRGAVKADGGPAYFGGPARWHSGGRDLAREPEERPDAPSLPQRRDTLHAHAQHPHTRRVAPGGSPRGHGLGAAHARRAGESGLDRTPAPGRALQSV